MKKLFILSLCALGFVACEKRDYVVISGKINNYAGMPVQFIGGNDVKKTLNIKPDGSFADTLKVESSYYTLFDQMSFYIPLYLEQGDELTLNIDPSKQPVEVKFSGKDTIANAYLQKKMIFTRELQQNFKSFFGKNTEDFKKDLTEIEKKYTDFLSNSSNLPKKFKSLEEKSIKYLILQLKSIYPQAYSHFTQEEIEMPAEFRDELAKIDYDNAEDYKMFNEYQQLVAENLYSKINPENPDWSVLINHIKSLKSENIKSSLSKVLVNGLSAANDSKINDEILNTIKTFVKDSAMVKNATEIYNNFEKLKPGKPSPSFNFENNKGEKVSLESLKGKLIYIDVWATWCVPCLNEIPALTTLEKEYHGKNIAFVSISIDQEKEKWTAYQTANKLSGIQLYADLSVEDNFAQAYNIQSIPRFILIDKEGNIINADAPRPSTDAIKELINKNL